jgi:hypothetical protein
MAIKLRCLVLNSEPEVRHLYEVGVNGLSESKLGRRCELTSSALFIILKDKYIAFALI